MREILFRGQTYIDNIWKYGMFSTNRSESIIAVWIERIEEFIRYGVYHETVGQYTGLKDKNGTEIYESDIVKCRWLAELGITEIDCEAVGVVNWQDDICMFYIDFTKPFVTHPCEDGRYEEEGMPIEKTVDGFTKNEFSVDYEVIGNIHDNPELVKEELK